MDEYGSEEHESDPEIRKPEWCNERVFNRCKWRAQCFLEEIQAAAILAGGRKFTLQELEEMPLNKLLFQFLPNGITFSVQYQKPCPPKEV